TQSDRSLMNDPTISSAQVGRFVSPASSHYSHFIPGRDWTDDPTGDSRTENLPRLAGRFHWVGPRSNRSDANNRISFPQESHQGRPPAADSPEAERSSGSPPSSLDPRALRSIVPLRRS